jgi:hypothetical protein
LICDSSLVTDKQLLTCLSITHTLTSNGAF